MMNTGFFDTNHIRRSETLRQNKNHASVMPLKIPILLIDNKPFGNLAEKSKARPYKIFFISLFQIL